MSDETRDVLEEWRALEERAVRHGGVPGDAWQSIASRLAAELERWRYECGPLLEFLTGDSGLCERPLDYAREQQARIDTYQAEIARLRAIEDSARHESAAMAVREERLRTLVVEMKEALQASGYHSEHHFIRVSDLLARAREALEETR